MGQYYRAIVKKQNRRITVYNRYIMRNGEKEYMMAKLTEHSWWLNEFVNAVCLDVYNRKEKNRIAWIGDYAESYLECRELKSFNGLNQRQISRLTHQCWDCEGIAVEPTDFTLKDKYLINHTKGEYIDCNEFYKNSIMHSKYGDWCFHPLPLLTCIGNSLGGGDYSSPTDDSTEDFIGSWAWNEISIEDNPPEGFTEILPIFKEQGWETE